MTATPCNKTDCNDPGHCCGTCAETDTPPLDEPCFRCRALYEDDDVCRWTPQA